MLAAATLLLALLAGAGAGDDRPLPAESSTGFQCRTQVQPRARRCIQVCRSTLEGEDPIFECVAGCTTRALDDLAACRSAPTVPAPALAVR